MNISEINDTIPGGELLMNALKLRSIETGQTDDECFEAVVKFGSMAGKKPLSNVPKFDYTADLLNQIRHLESERNRLQDALDNKRW